MQLLCAGDHESLPFDSWLHLSPVATWRSECRFGISQSLLPLPICHQDPRLRLLSPEKRAHKKVHTLPNICMHQYQPSAVPRICWHAASTWLLSFLLQGTFCISHICRNTKCCWMQTIQGLIGWITSMLPCVPHLINIAQLGGLGKKEQRGIWRAGEAVFAHESEILSEVPAEPARGRARQRAASGGEPPRGCGSDRDLLTVAFPFPENSPPNREPRHLDSGRGPSWCCPRKGWLLAGWKNVSEKFRGWLIPTPC